MKIYYRWTHIFGLDRNSPEKIQALRDYVARRKAEEKKLDGSCVAEFFCTSSYEDLIIAEPDELSEQSRLVQAFIVVIHGVDYVNFIRGLLNFASEFPEELYPRVDCYAFTLKDESNDLSDIIGR